MIAGIFGGGLAAISLFGVAVAGISAATESSCERANRLEAEIRALELEDARPIDYTKLKERPSLAEVGQLYDDATQAISDCAEDTFGDGSDSDDSDSDDAGSGSNSTGIAVDCDPRYRQGLPPCPD